MNNLTQEQFIYWLKGFLDGDRAISSKEVSAIKDKLNTLTGSVTITSYPFNPDPSILGGYLKKSGITYTQLNDK